MRIGLPPVPLAAPAVVRARVLRPPVMRAASRRTSANVAVAVVVVVDAIDDGGTAVITIPTNLNTLFV